MNALYRRLNAYALNRLVSRDWELFFLSPWPFGSEGASHGFLHDLSEHAIDIGTRPARRES
jgi:hypothetical protein